MKINWGTSIVIAFALFISFILYFVIRVQTDSKYDNEMVIEEYYKKDSRYSEEMIKMQNAMQLNAKPAIKVNSDGVEIVFPEDFDPKQNSGTVSFYRPSNKKLDFEMPISNSKPYLFIPKSDLAGGLWGITIEWKYLGKEYMIKEKIYLN
ncbi:MAG: FixH family protein [Flavobacterium sp.]